MPDCLIFVSRAPLGLDQARREADRITSLALPAGVTGGLIHSGRYFAGRLEGEPAALDLLIAGLAAEPCHEELVVLDRRAIAKRHHRGFALAYAGLSSWLDRSIAPFFTGQFGKLSRPEALTRLDGLLSRFLDGNVD